MSKFVKSMQGSLCGAALQPFSPSAILQGTAPCPLPRFVASGTHFYKSMLHPAEEKKERKKNRVDP